MSIELCYSALPDRLLIARKDASGCPETDNPDDWAATIPGVILRKDRSSLQITIPTPLDPGMLIDRHCVVIGRNSTRRRSGTIFEIDLLGQSSLVTIKLTT